MPTPEDLARENIDLLLTATGWFVRRPTNPREVRLEAPPCTTVRKEVDIRRPSNPT
jgi:hypothetical protein